MSEIIIIAIFSGLVGSSMVAYVMHHYNKRQLQSTTLTTIFKILTDEKHWTARRNVLKSYKEFIKNTDLILEVFDEKDMRIVRSDFDQIGIMIYQKISKEQIGDKHLDKDNLVLTKGFIPSELFFEAFAGSVINSWYALEYIIKFQRKHVYSERFMLFFEQLYKDALDYQQERSKLQKEREDDSEIKKKMVTWINNIPNEDPSEIENVKNW